jgi:predicted nucleic acid-binding protein
MAGSDVALEFGGGDVAAPAVRYRFSLYDSILVSSALIVGAKVLYSEDLRHAQVIDGQLKVINPFPVRAIPG